MTNKQRYSVIIEPDLLEQLTNYRHKYGITSQSKAIQVLLYDALNSGEKSPAVHDEGRSEWEDRLRSLSPSDLRLFGQVLQGLEDKPEEMRAVLDLALRAVRPVPQTP